MTENILKIHNAKFGSYDEIHIMNEAGLIVQRYVRRGFADTTKRSEWMMH